jgi:hypothetical protein
LGLGLAAIVFIAWACSTSEGGSNFVGGGTGGGVGLGDNTGGTGTATGSGLPGGGSTGLSTESGTMAPGDRRPPVCDAEGKNCKCTTFASFGATATYGSGSDSTTDFELWLTEKSNLAAVDFYKTDTPITADLLGKYDVILLQDLRAWQLDATEVQLFQDWINNGGGVIALSGYESNSTVEIVPTNQLLGSTGVQLLPDEVPGEACVAAESYAVCNNPSSNNGNKCYCWGVSLPLTDFNTTHAITKNMRSVGSFRGRAVSPGEGSEVVVSYHTTPVGVTKTVGAGKVFVFGDEWITYTSQWGDYKTETAALAAKYLADPNSLQYESCWDAASKLPCTAKNVFQTMQFWYNSILWVQPPSTCTFIIDEPDDIIL